MSIDPRHSRRRFLTGLGGALGTSLAAGALHGGRASADADAPPTDPDPRARRLLFVVCASGGGSIIDSFLPISTEQVPGSVDASQLDVYEPGLIAQPAGSNIRCVRPLPDTLFLRADYSIEAFLESHYQDLTIVTQEGTSVNHAVAQKRALNGAGINNGRTIAEAVAERHGVGLPLANCNMGVDGYVEPGDDPSLPGYARSELIADPQVYAMSTHGSRGIAGAPRADALAHARSAREALDEVSAFAVTFRDVGLRARYLHNRREVSPQLETLDAVTKLMLLPTDDVPASLGLGPSPLASELRTVFPDLDTDYWHQEGALAFLLAYYGLTCASTIALRSNPAFDEGELVGAPLAYDFSHTYHRPTQSVMWSRVLRVVHGLISLLQRYDYLGDPALGKMWDRSLIYIATDFGRDKVRPAGSEIYGTGHHLNNGSVLLSPLLKGNRVFGAVDPATLLTHGFDRQTGEPVPGTVMREGDIYSLIAQAMDVDFPGRRSMAAVLA